VIQGLATLLRAQREPGAAELREALRSLLDGSKVTGRLCTCRRIKERVYRLRFEIGGAERNLIVKRLDPDVARRNRLVATRWLPAVGLGDRGPPFLASAAEAAGESVWHVYRDLGDATLDVPQPRPADVEAAVDLIADIHILFSGHPLLGECRLWGGDLGMHFYVASVHDAIAALRGLVEPRVRLEPHWVALRDRLLSRLGRLEDETPRRGGELRRHGGPDTLLHGDLWRNNIVPAGDNPGAPVRLIDWDHAAAGPAVYDLSTLLSRFEPPQRPWILERYRRRVERAGRALPGARALNALADTAEAARIANRVIWPAIAMIEGERSWAPEALAEVERWFDSLGALLPEDST
jgi:hypothetical protein